MRLLACCLLALPVLDRVAPATCPQAADYLPACWWQQVWPLQDRYLQLRYRKTGNELEHSMEPWQTTAYTGRGTVWANADTFLKQDTLTAVASGRTYF